MLIKTYSYNLHNSYKKIIIKTFFNEVFFCKWKTIIKNTKKISKKEVKEALMLTKYVISFKWRVTMSGELMS